jgi:hypothetical protein
MSLEEVAYDFCHTRHASRLVFRFVYGFDIYFYWFKRRGGGAVRVVGCWGEGI